MNSLPARATSYSYESEQDALVKDRSTSRMMLLNGMWKFHFAPGGCRRFARHGRPDRPDRQSRCSWCSG